MLPTASSMPKRGSRVELTTGPLDRVETRGFLAADTMGSTEVSTLDAAKVGKRVQERAGVAKQRSRRLQSERRMRR